MLEEFGGFDGKGVRAAVYRRVGVQVEVAFSIKNLEWFLAGGAGIEVDERVAVDDGVENREVCAQRSHGVVVERRVGGD